MTKAREWWELAAAQGNARAQGNLGVLYGQGVDQGITKAREWYELAAAQGLAMAMTNLAALFANDNGVEQDLNEAMR